MSIFKIGHGDNTVRTTDASHNYPFAYPDITWPKLLEPFSVATSSTITLYPVASFKDGAATVELDLPGVKKTDLSLELLQGYIHVKSNRKGLDRLDYVYVGDSELDFDKSEAVLEDGVLTLNLYLANKPAKSIKIK